MPLDDHGHVPGSPEQSWEFITVTGENLGGDAATRRRVRSHVVAHSRRRNPPCRRAKTFELNITPLLEGSLQDVPNPLIQTEAVLQGDGSMDMQLYSSGSRDLDRREGMCSSMSGFVCPGPATLLDASRSDPFGTFPIDRSRRSRELWDHCKGENLLRNLIR